MIWVFLSLWGEVEGMFSDSTTEEISLWIHLGF